MENRKSYNYRGMAKTWSHSGGCSAVTSLPMFSDTHATGMILDEGDKEKLKVLNKTYSESKTSNKGTYASWLRYFEIGRGHDNNDQ